MADIIMQVCDACNREFPPEISCRLDKCKIRALLTAADLAEVVRCKDCRWSRELDYSRPREVKCDEECVWCTERDEAMYEEEFCSYGERKDNERT